MPRKQAPKKPAKSDYAVDGIVYKSKNLYDFHIECKEAVNNKLIKEFSIPQKLNSKSRYSTYKPVIDDIEFDSLMEAKYYIHLMAQKKAGVIKSFERQVPFELQPRFKKEGKIYRPITYISDFVVYYQDKTYVIDIKGTETTEFKLKRKLFEYKFPDLHLNVIQYSPKEDAWLELDELKKLNRKRTKVAKRKLQQDTA